MKDGAFYTNSVTTSTGPTEFTMVNSMINKNQLMRKEGDAYLTDAFEDGTINTLLKDNVTVGETWEIKFKANTLDSILVMTVKELNTTKEVNGKSYTNVMMIEAESKIIMNETLMPLNFFTQYYYSKGVGLIMTTSSMGDAQSLVEFKVG
ncbi:hypothetical protein BH10BAC1_BH10BAC1_18490 [soil metagenome]